MVCLMEESLEIKEKYSVYWKPGLIISLLISFSTFLIYQNLDDVLWAGIFRLVAFICLTIGIFCMLKLMEGAKTFEINISEGKLNITYMKNDEIIGSERLQTEQIKAIYSEPYQIKFPFVDYQITLSNNCNFKVTLIGEEKSDVSLFKFGGKVLTVDNKSEKRLKLFLKQYDLYS